MKIMKNKVLIKAGASQPWKNQGQNVQVNETEKVGTSKDGELRQGLREWFPSFIKRRMRSKEDTKNARR